MRPGTAHFACGRQGHAQSGDAKNRDRQESARGCAAALLGGVRGEWGIGARVPPRVDSRARGVATRVWRQDVVSACGSAAGKLEAMDKSLEEQVLNLPPADRAKLAHELLESLDALSPAELDALWAQEAERRARELDSGAVDLVPGSEVARKAQALAR